ncbi:phosphotransferase family protein [Sandarakinorhabdus sp. AAP62]|uniref:phosphotransferase family protein n=1 Tax=Sandarakinorhabdus sp. AAP62 TaxID=1248916 RepID=UPI0002E6DB39|nr:phosphotransferase family protein [Sandarakinorhabdus sp. AAP62]
MSDLDRLAAWLPDQGLALAPGARLERLGGGIANRNEGVMLSSGPVVLRRPPPGVLAAGASDMAREAKVLAALSAHFPLVPSLIAFCDDESVLGTKFQIIERRDGVAIAGALPPQAEDGLALVETTLQAMAALHALDPAPVGLGDLGKPEGFNARQLKGWTARAEAVWPDGLPAHVAALIAALAAHVPPETGTPVLLHMDLKPDNLLVDPVTLKPNAMIDWDMATRGPRGFDLAVLLSYWIEPGDPVDVKSLQAVPSLTPGWPGRAAVAARYQAISGHDPGDLVWPTALARLRLAVAWMQLYRKWQRGEMDGTRYAGFETLALAIVAHALAQYQKGAL